MVHGEYSRFSVLSHLSFFIMRVKGRSHVHSHNGAQAKITSIPCIFFSSALFLLLYNNSFLSYEKKSVKLKEDSSLAVISEEPKDTTMGISYEVVLENEQFIRLAAYEKKSSSNTKEPLSIRKWAEAIAENSQENARILTDTILQYGSTYNAFFFETKGCSYNSSKKKQFEFVLMNSPALHQFCQSAGADEYAFAEYLSFDKDDDIKPGASFTNLGGTSQLVAPTKLPGQSASSYSHLAIFLREAPRNQIFELWKMVCENYLLVLQEEKDATYWLSTSGMGVSYLHFRIDDRPKYYTYKEFKQEF